MAVALFRCHLLTLALAVAVSCGTFIAGCGKDERLVESGADDLFATAIASNLSADADRVDQTNISGPPNVVAVTEPAARPNEFTPPDEVGTGEIIGSPIDAKAKKSDRPLEVTPSPKSQLPANFVEVKQVGFRVQPFVTAYCVSCHKDGKDSGGLRLDTIGDLTAGEDIEHWEAVLDRLNLGDMPPDDTPKTLSDEERNSAVEWLNTELHRAIESSKGDAEVVLRRLNRNEYDNTIRDLLGIVGYAGSEMLPEDDSAHGFDNNAAALVMSPLLLEQYMAAADVALEMGLAGYLGKVPEARKQVFDPLDQMIVTWGALKGELDYNVREHEGQLALVYERPLRTPSVKVGGTYIYRIRARALRSGVESAILTIDAGQPTNGNPPRIRFGGFSIAEGEATTIELQCYLRPREFVEASYNNSGNGRPTVGGGRYPLKLNPDFDFEKSKAVIVESVELEGPFYSIPARDWPSALPRDVESQPLRQTLTEFAERAFRRPVMAGELDAIFSLAESIKSKSGLKEAIRVGFKAILCSPGFLYMNEEPGPLDDYAIASRMSYFLWSSMPDGSLMELAKAGRLSDPSVRAKEVRRMLADDKAEAFVRNFAGQWLQVRKVGENRPDAVIYPEYDHQLEIWVQEEAFALFREVLRDQDRSLTEFLDSDFVMINEGLAKLYGIEGVSGSELRRVALSAADRRGGVLGLASLQTVTSNGTVTSPIVRGAWIMENLLGTPPPPPPPDVPAIEADISGNLTIKEQLAQHREIKACASCHAKMDPLGFAMENYDVMGGWRTNYRIRKSDEPPRGRGPHWKSGAEVDPTGVLATGENLGGLNDLKAYLKSRRADFARCLTEKLIAYGTGREPRTTDRPAINAIVDRIAAQDFQYPLAELVTDVVNSKPFLTK
ncbi:hypothetical protein Pan189_10070 [Stratiformator vulcanicus]|uniref:Planctomycete cytochrome C n=2 Tax=Stratiformator vulcanicus TaxID=2527980 RepID=A0A517QYB5_9PLAN|nr:hypothetical protein Pan189_10070 [Stratiformator vulcanicus]